MKINLIKIHTFTLYCVSYESIGIEHLNKLFISIMKNDHIDAEAPEVVIKYSQFWNFGSEPRSKFVLTTLH